MCICGKKEIKKGGNTNKLKEEKAERKVEGEKSGWNDERKRRKEKKTQLIKEKDK